MKILSDDSHARLSLSVYAFLRHYLHSCTLSLYFSLLPFRICLSQALSDALLPPFSLFLTHPHRSALTDLNVWVGCDDSEAGQKTLEAREDDGLAAQVHEA
jgi:hypothetical protein